MIKAKNEVMKDLGKVLDKKITVQKLTTITTENGFDEEKWLDVKVIWSSINNLYGKEFWSAKAVQSENTVEFVVRYNKHLEEMNTKNYRIYWDNKSYNITFIDNIQYQNKWIKIKATEVV